jgi:hypothetical protein
MTTDFLLGVVAVVLLGSCVAVLRLWRRVERVEDVLKKQCVFNELAGRALKECVRREELN